MSSSNMALRFLFPFTVLAIGFSYNLCDQRLTFAQDAFDSSKGWTEGGMRFKTRDQDIIRMSSSSVSGLRLGGSAGTKKSTIQVGSAASEVISELNPLNASEINSVPRLLVAGSPEQWATTQALQRTTPSGTEEDHQKRKSRGTLDPRLSDLLIEIQANDKSNLRPLLTEHTIGDPSTGEKTKKLVTTSDYDILNSLLSAEDSQGRSLTKGVHVLSIKTSSSSNPVNQSMDSSGQSIGWAESSDGTGLELRVSPTYASTVNDVNENIVKASKFQSTSTDQFRSKFEIVGFSKNPKPDQGKSSTISAFATNNRSVGTLTPKSGDTLESLAKTYGVTVEELLRVNNLPSADINVEGLKLVVPSDLSTIGQELVGDNETVDSFAKRMSVDTAWILQLNKLSDPYKPLIAGTKLLVPGRRPKGSAILPPAKPLPPELEYADYGAYTTYEVTYHVEGSLTPLFSNTLKSVFR